MLKKLVLTTAIALLAACSSSDNNTTTPPVITPPTGGGGTGTTEGSWTGTNDFGTTYTIIDGNGALFGFTANGAGQFRSTFGNISGELEQFAHRASDNPALGEAYTVVGDVDPVLAPAVTYSFSVSDDGNTLTNNSGAGAFSLAVANIPDLSIADIAGDWVSRTAFCATCPLTVEISIAADGTLTGSSSFSIDGGDTTVSTLTGAVSGSGTFLGVQFNFNGDSRNGVLYQESGTGRLIMNSFGPDSANSRNASFSALFSR